MAGQYDRVRLLPFWLKEERGQCAVLSGAHPSPQGLGILTRTHPLKVESSVAVVFVTLLGATIKCPTRSNLRDEGLFLLLVQAGSPSWQECGAASYSMEDQEAKKAQCTQLSLSFHDYLFWNPNPWGGATHNKGEFPFLRTLWKLLAS